MLSAIIFLVLNMKKIINTLFGLLILTACSSASESTAPAAIPSISEPSPVALTAVPTFYSPNNSILWQELQVTMDQAEITQDFITEFGSTRSPSPGDKFLWIHIQLKNAGKVEMDTPLPEHFSALYAAAEFKPSYGHRKDHTDYTSLQPTLFPDQGVEAWLRFDIPADAELKDLRFIFLPESSHVGTSFSSPNYPYGAEHPTFVWNCAQ